MKTRKTAGTSIEMLLEPLCAPPGHVVNEETETLVSKFGVVASRLIPRDPDAPRDIRAWREHLQTRFVRQNVGRRVWEKYFRFTAVRNPFDRAVSYFYWRYDHEAWKIPSDLDGKKAAFRDFVTSDLMKHDRAIVHQGGKYEMQDAIRYESLNADLARICEQRNLPVDVSQLPKAKSNTSRSKRLPVSAHFDAETTQTVLDEMSWVFDRFDYSRNPDDCDQDQKKRELQWS